MGHKHHDHYNRSITVVHHHPDATSDRIESRGQGQRSMLWLGLKRGRWDLDLLYREQFSSLELN